MLCRLAPFLLVALACVGRATPRALTSAGSINISCPISGKAIETASPTIDYGDHKIAFCCNDCRKQWQAMTDDEQAALRKAQLQAQSRR